MATRTSAQSGLWSAATTWDTGVPVNGDSVIIAAGHVVEFDVDQSAFATGIAGVTLNGTLRASTTPGAYVLKLAGHMTPNATGRLEAGTEAAPYPANCSFEIRVNGNYYAVNGGTNAVALYGQVPQYLTAKLAVAASAGYTVLTLDTDVSSDWHVGDTVYICNINKGRNGEQRTIAALGVGTITLSSGLTGSKLVGSVVALSTRNVRFIGSGSSAGRGIYGGTGAILSGVEIRGMQYGINSGSNHTLTGCTFSGNTYGISVSYTRLYDCVLTGNSYDLSVAAGVARESTFASAVQHQNYSRLTTTQFVVWDVDGIAGAVRAWMAGGRIVSDEAILPPDATLTLSHKLIFERATSDAPTNVPTPVYIDFPLSHNGLGQIKAAAWLRRDTDVMTEPLRAQIINLDEDPLYGGVPVAEAAMTVGVDEWQRLSLHATVQTNQQYALRIIGRNGSGNGWAQWKLDMPAMYETLVATITEDELVANVTD